MTAYTEWMDQPAYIGKGTTEGTMRDALLHFFYEGVSPWITSFGYEWINGETCVSKKFLRFCYDIHVTLLMGDNYSLQVPEPKHRDYLEDRETFDFIVDHWSFVELLEEWDCRDEIVGTRLDYLLREFCYVWIDVTAGKPGSWTKKSLDAEYDEIDIDEQNALLPDPNWNRSKYDLY
jgi:hypothetical protein